MTSASKAGHAAARRRLTGPGYQLTPEELDATLERREAGMNAAADVLVSSNLTIAQLTPREQAEAAWTPTLPAASNGELRSVDDLEDLIRQERGMAPLDRSTGGGA